MKPFALYSKPRMVPLTKGYIFVYVCVLESTSGIAFIALLGLIYKSHFDIYTKKRWGIKYTLI